VTLRITARFALSCPRHPRYDPECGGQGAIKAGCDICSQMCRIWRSSLALQQEYHDLAEKIVQARRAEKGS